jgi:L-amino acid N-acyltransferase YncA
MLNIRPAEVADLDPITNIYVETLKYIQMTVYC